MQGRQQFVARDAQGFGGAVQVQAMAGFVLDLRQQHRLAFQRRRARHPVALRQLADDFRVRVLGDLAHQRLAVGVGHPVLCLDLHAGIDSSLEGLFLGAHVFVRLDLFQSRLHHLCVHAQSPVANIVQQ
jgi:hypothetical protein